MKYNTLGAMVLGLAMSYSPMAGAYDSRTSIDDSVRDVTYQPIAGLVKDLKKGWKKVKTYSKETVEELCREYPEDCREIRREYRKWKRKNKE